jgi:hypothetical protein
LSLYNEILNSHLSIKKNLPVELWNLASDVIEIEMNTTKNLSKWPCRSFKELKDDLIVQPFYDLSPDCSGNNKFTKCFVSHDIADQKPKERA